MGLASHLFSACCLLLPRAKSLVPPGANASDLRWDCKKASTRMFPINRRKRLLAAKNEANNGFPGERGREGDVAVKR
jgi:hypothetical protein